MLRRVPGWLLIYVLAVIALTIRIPIVQTHHVGERERQLARAYTDCVIDWDDENCDAVTERYRHEHTREWEWAYVNELGDRDDGTVVRFAWGEYLIKLGCIFFLCLVFESFLDEVVARLRRPSTEGHRSRAETF